MEEKEIIFLNTECNIKTFKYQNNRTGLMLVDKNSKEPIVKITINIPEIDVNDMCKKFKIPQEKIVLIKDYAENEGILDILVKAKIVKTTNVSIRTSYAFARVCILI